MKKKNSRLFTLVHSLSSKEKRFYIRHAQRQKKGENHLYLSLFRAVDEQKEYDEAALKDKFVGTSFGKSLAFPKSHLYDQILRALQVYHYEKNLPTLFRSELEKIELLMGRGFPDQALRILKKSLLRAIRYEKALEVLQLLRWKRRITLRLQGGAYSEEIKEIAAIEQDWQRAFEQEQLAIDLHDRLYARFQEKRRVGGVSNAAEIKGIKKSIDTLLEAEDLRFGAKAACYRASAHFYHMGEDFKGVHDAYRAEIHLWEAHPHQIEADPLRFVRAFGQWLSSKALIKDYAELLAEIERLRGYQQFDSQGRAEVFQLTYNLELFYYLNAGKMKEAMALSGDIDMGLQTHEKQLLPSAVLGFYYNLAVVHWLGKEPGKSLRWTHKILHAGTGEVRRDIRDFAPLLEKLLHFELGNAEVLESWFRAFEYRRKRKKEKDRLEALLLKLIRKAWQSVPGEVIHPVWEEFLQDLQVYSGIEGVSRVGLMELKQWAKGKLPK